MEMPNPYVTRQRTGASDLSVLIAEADSLRSLLLAESCAIEPDDLDLIIDALSCLDPFLGDRSRTIRRLRFVADVLERYRGELHDAENVYRVLARLALLIP